MELAYSLVTDKDAAQMLQQLSNVNFVADRHKKNAGRKERHGYKCTCCGKVNHKPFD